MRNRRQKSGCNNDASSLDGGADHNDHTANDSTHDASAQTKVHHGRIPKSPSNSVRLRSVILVLKWILHVAAIACFVAGIILRTSRLHTGEECDMTYSMRVFLKVDTASKATISESDSPATSRYGLYKFIDQRDPRYTQLLQQNRNGQTQLGRNEHCANSSDNIVVYVPGHWGTYDQARSLGAHGIQMTGLRENKRLAQQRLLNSKSNSHINNSTESFVYDVYSLDFAEQGGGLHGQFLRYQTDYLAACLEQLSEDCGRQTQIIVVAHSMGGYVARKVLQENPNLRVENLVTLATPHSNPLYSFDRSVSDFHRELQGGSTKNKLDHKEPLVVSISGGLRDEMIEPSACEASSPQEISVSGVRRVLEKFRGLSEEVKDDALDSWTILATRLVAKPTKSKSVTEERSSGLGMDHRAIVWCHQLLQEVRQILWVLVASSEKTAQERLENVKVALGTESEIVDYPKDLNEMKKGLSDSFGSFQALCMEASMIYNLPYLLALYALLVGFRCARVTTSHRASSMLPVLATILVGWIFRSDLGWLSTLILVLVANSFNLVLIRLLPVGFLLRVSGRQKPPLRALRDALVTTLALILAAAFGLAIAFCCLFGDGTRMLGEQNWSGLLASTLYAYAIASIYVMLVVWVGFIENNPVRRIIDKTRSITKGDNGESFEIQLVTFVMTVVPFLVTGPLVLMVWEHWTQQSSWWTLLSLQIPVGILVSARLSKIRILDSQSSGDDGDRAPLPNRRRRGGIFLPLIRSISIYLCLFFLLCCREPGLFCRGTGYLVPDLAIMLSWVGIAQSLFG